MVANEYNPIIAELVAAENYEYPITFEFVGNDSITVEVYELYSTRKKLTLDIDYEIKFSSVSHDYSIVIFADWTVDPPETEGVGPYSEYIITRSTTTTQTMDASSGFPLNRKTMEKGLDKLTLMVQDLDYYARRSSPAMSIAQDTVNHTITVTYTNENGIEETTENFWGPLGSIADHEWEAGTNRLRFQHPTSADNSVPEYLDDWVDLKPEHTWVGPILTFQNADGTDGTSTNLMPDHAWVDTTLAFYHPDGTIGTYTELMPDHDWQGTTLAFAEPGGTFVTYVDLKGEKGEDGDAIWDPSVQIDEFHVTNVADFVDTGIDLLVATTITGAGNTLKLIGGGIGDANVCNISFYESNGTVQQGYIGMGTGANSDMQIASINGEIGLLDNTTITGVLTVDASLGITAATTIQLKKPTTITGLMTSTTASVGGDITQTAGVTSLKATTITNTTATNALTVSQSAVDKALANFVCSAAIGQNYGLYLKAGSDGTDYCALFLDKDDNNLVKIQATGINLYKPTTITGTSNTLKLIGGGVGDANVNFISFYESNGSVIQGYVGIGTGASSDMQIASTNGEISLLDNTTITGVLTVDASLGITAATTIQLKKDTLVTGDLSITDLLLEKYSVGALFEGTQDKYFDEMETWGLSVGDYVGGSGAIETPVNNNGYVVGIKKLSASQYQVTFINDTSEVVTPYVIVEGSSTVMYMYFSGSRELGNVA